MEGVKNLLIVYGTSTGTAKEVALRIAREGYNIQFGNPAVHYFLPEVMSMKDVTIDYLIDHYQVGDGKKVVFVVSTTGQGEFPEDSKRFWRDLCKKTGVPKIEIEFVVIGLGDSSYEYYNYPAKKLHRRLEQLSAQPSFPACLCDDQHDLGYLGALNPYLASVWFDWVWTTQDPCVNTELLPRYTFMPAVPEQQPVNKTTRRIERRRLIRNERVTGKDHLWDTRVIAFDTVNSGLQFEAGDVLQVYPENFPENVELFFQIFPKLKNQKSFYVGCDPDMGWEAIPAELYQVVGPQPWTWEQIAAQLLDLQAIPSAYTFEVLRRFTNDENLKEKYDEFCTPEGLQELYNYVNRPRRTILEVLLDFTSLSSSDLPAEYIFDIIPFIRPRAFSIASPPKEKHHIEILVAVVEYKTNLQKSRKGTCSYWLGHHCAINQSVAVYCEKGSLRPPPIQASQANIIMIGTGTGVAPFRSMIKENLGLWNKNLMFGCRNKNDLYFEKEFMQFEKDDQLNYRYAFSRDEKGMITDKREYVQHLVAREKGRIQAMLQSGLPVYVYVCGRSGGMPKDVYSGFKNILQLMGVEDPDQYMKDMLNSGLYQAETY